MTLPSPPARSDLIREVEHRVLPALHRLAAELRARFPDADVSVFSNSVGDLTPFQGHDVGLECALNLGASTADDWLVLSVSTCHLSTNPRMNADVSWPSGPTPHPDVPAGSRWTTSNDWPLATPERLDLLASDVERLADLFRKKVADEMRLRSPPREPG